MKFVLKSVQNGSRLGLITECRFGSGKEMATPLCMVYSRAGCIPYLTLDVISRLENVPTVCQLPCNLLLDHIEALNEYKAGVGKFTGLEDFIIYCHLQDSSLSLPKGYNDLTGVSAWSRGGKKKLDAERFMNMMDIFQPNWFQALADSDTDKESSKKRIKKSVDRTLDYLDQCINRKESSFNLKEVDLIGVIEGGYDKNERLRSATETVKRCVSGFSFEGFHSFGPKMESFRFSDEVEEILKATIDVLPADKLRFFPGLFRPTDVIRAVRFGFDVFDGTYPFAVTERGSALIFQFQSIVVDDRNHESLSSIVADGEKTSDDDYSFEISLKDSKFKNIFVPILCNCSCYSCRNFTCAYVHHLLMTGELLGSLLLMIHNCHHYFGFFDALRTSMSANQLNAFEKDLINRVQQN